MKSSAAICITPTSPPSSASDGGNDGRIACGIAEIVLNHQNRTESILFTAEDGGQVGVIQIAALDFIHGIPLLISKAAV